MTDQAKARAIKEIREAIANYEITKVQLAELADCHPDTVRRMVKGVPGSRGIRASTLQALIKALGTHRTKMAAASRVKPGKGNGGSRHMRTRKDGELPPEPLEAHSWPDVAPQPTKAERAAELPRVEPKWAARALAARDDLIEKQVKELADLQAERKKEKAHLVKMAQRSEQEAGLVKAYQTSIKKQDQAKALTHTELDAALLELEEAEQLITMGTRRAGRAKAAIVRALSKLGAAP